MARPRVVASIGVRDGAGRPRVVDVLRAVAERPGRDRPSTLVTVLRLRGANRQVWPAGEGRFRDGDGRIYVAAPPAAP